MLDTLKSPFRPAPFGLEALRSFFRFVRWIPVYIRNLGKVKLGHTVVIGKNPDIRVLCQFELGNFVGIGKNFTCEVDAIIGNHVLISSNVAFVSRDHLFDDPNETVYTQGRDDRHRIVIEDDVLIGFGSIVIAPATLKKGCIVGAGAVVTGDLGGNVVCVGVPAKPVRERFKK